MILAADIGGTKADLALFEDVQARKMVKHVRFLCREYKSLEEIVREFLSDVSSPITSACLGIAGPIEKGYCRATNLPWVVSLDKLKELVKTERLFLLNDLEANAWGTFILREDELYTLSEGVGPREGTKAILSAGTGLGEACLYFDGQEYHPFASEGGHVNFAPSSEEDVEIWRYFSDKFGHVSYERFLCGAGLGYLYRFFVEVKKEKELDEVRKKMTKEDPARVVNEYGTSGACPICKRVLEKFARIYGSEAGNVALKFLALGGIYIGGGIAPKILKTLKEGEFLQAFKEKGRMSSLLSSIRIEVILNPHTALLGAGLYAVRKSGA